MNVKKIALTTVVMLVSSVSMAELAPKAVDLGKLYGLYQKSGYSSLELMEPESRMLISGVVRDIGQSLSNNSYLSVGTAPNSQELGRLVAADETQEYKLKSLQVGGKFKAVCDLAFTSGTKYMSFQGCVFK